MNLVLTGIGMVSTVAVVGIVFIVGFLLLFGWALSLDRTMSAALLSILAGTVAYVSTAGLHVGGLFWVIAGLLVIGAYLGPLLGEKLATERISVKGWVFAVALLLLVILRMPISVQELWQMAPASYLQVLAVLATLGITTYLSYRQESQSYHPAI